MDINNILDQFADDVVEIDIWNKKIEGTLDFSRFSKLIKLNCRYNKITNLDNLPNSLIELSCYNNQIISLDNLSDLDDTVKDYNQLMEKYNNSLKN